MELQHYGKSFSPYRNPKRQCSNTANHKNIRCAECQKCLHCNCICHTVFQKRNRFFTEERQIWVLDCTDLVRGYEIKYSFETECQLNGKSMISKLSRIADYTKESDSLQKGTEKDHHRPTEVLDFQNEYRIQPSIIPCVSLEADVCKKDQVTGRKPAYGDCGQSMDISNCRTIEIRRIDCYQNKDTYDQQRNSKMGMSGRFVHETAVIDTPTRASIYVRHGMRNHVSHKPVTVPICSDESVEYDAV